MAAKTDNALTKITIHQLQRLKNISLEFSPVGVTAIVGVNGSGKSTLLRALACVFQPKQSIQLPQNDYRPAQYFIPYDGCDWSGSHYEVWLEDLNEESRTYKKEAGLSWQPNPTTRFHRYTKYIGIGDAIPHLESDTESEAIPIANRAAFFTNSAKTRTFISKVSATLNRSYSNAGSLSKSTGKVLSYMFAEASDRTYGSLIYPSHYMGAGEQKIFEIVKSVVDAPDGALILIEEPEVSLHSKAMKDLVTFLIEQATQKSLQIIFSTHWLGIKDFESKVSCYSLNIDPTTEQVSCDKGLSPNDYLALSGDRTTVKKLVIWVEDVLARRIVEQIANDLGLKAFIKKILIAKSSRNLFVVAASLVIQHDVVKDTMLVGDGDREITIEEKNNIITDFINGPNEWAINKHREAVSLFCDFLSPENLAPEDFLLSLSSQVAASQNPPQWLVHDLAAIQKITPAVKGKEAFYKLALDKAENEDSESVANELGRLHERFLSVVTNLPDWQNYIKPVAEKISALCREHNLTNTRLAQTASVEVMP